MVAHLSGMRPRCQRGRSEKALNMFKPSFEEFKELSKRGNLIPVYREIIADTETPVTALLKMRRALISSCWRAWRAGKNGGATASSGATSWRSSACRAARSSIEENGAVRRLPHGGDPLRCPEGAPRAATGPFTWRAFRGSSAGRWDFSATTWSVTSKGSPRGQAMAFRPTTPSS